MRKIANKLKMNRSCLARTLQLANLAPDIVKLIRENRQAETLTLKKLRIVSKQDFLREKEIF